DDMAELALMPGRDLAEADLQARLASGQMCLGARHRGSVVAFTWCNLRQCMIERHALFELRDDEASLFDAYTVESFRGRDLARWMRYRCYEELAAMGRRRCYSVTIVFNTPAVRFKQKLGAKVIGRGVYVDLVARSQFHFGVQRPD
ncbi:MAG: GNAT family N-acetyltransferase, partial [Gemmatimonadaceae bacterium]